MTTDGRQYQADPGVAYSYRSVSPMTYLAGSLAKRSEAQEETADRD